MDSSPSAAAAAASTPQKRLVPLAVSQARSGAPAFGQSSNNTWPSRITSIATPFFAAA